MQTSNRDVVEYFLRHRIDNKQGTPNTWRSYRIDLEHYAAYCNRARLDLLILTPQDMLGYVNSLSENLKPSSIRRRIAVLRELYKFLRESGKTTACPLTGIIAPQEREQVESRPPLSQSELEQLLAAAADGNTPLLLRDIAIIHVLSDAGLLVSECAQLSVDSFDTVNRCLWIWRDEEVRRAVPLSFETCDAITEWLSVRDSYLLTPFDKDRQYALFLSYRSTPMPERSITRMISQHGKKAGFATDVCAQTLRNTCAQRLSQEGRTAEEIQNLLGHVRKNTTLLMLERM